MKKIYLLFLSLIAITAMVNGQLKLTAKVNAFVVGESHDFIFTNAGNEGDAGKNVIWNFTGLKANGQTR